MSNIKAGVVHVEQLGNSLKPDSMKRMGHDTDRHMQRVSGAKTIDASKNHVTNHGIKAVAGMVASPLNTQTPLNKGHKKP